MSLFRPTEKRALDYGDVWGAGGDWTSIQAGSVDAALRLVPVFAATSMIAGTGSTLPIDTYRIDRTTGREVKLENDHPLIAEPTLFGGTEDWVHRELISRLFRGNSYGLVTEANAYGPTRIEWLHPDEVSVDNDRTVGRPVWRWNGEIQNPRDFVHIPGYTFPGLVLGVAPISVFAMTTETGLRAEEYVRDFYGAKGHPSAILESDQMIGQPGAEAIKKRFQAAAKSREPVVMGAGVKYKPIQLKPEEVQYLGIIKATATQIAAIYGIEPEDIGGESGNSMTYSNIEHRAIAFAMRTLRPYLYKFERAISRLLPERQYIRFNIDAIIRPDLITRYKAHEMALRNGWKNRDEVRELEHLEPIKGGKETNWPPYATQKAAPAVASAPGGTNGVNPPPANGARPEPEPVRQP